MQTVSVQPTSRILTIQSYGGHIPSKLLVHNFLEKYLPLYSAGIQSSTDVTVT